MKNQKSAQVGLVPFEYIKKRRNLDVLGVKIKETTALYEYTAADTSEISFIPGDIIEVIEQFEVTEEAWWVGINKRTSKKGSFPLIFTKGWESGKDASNSSQPTSLSTEILHHPTSSTPNHKIDSSTENKGIYSSILGWEFN